MEKYLGSIFLMNVDFPLEKFFKFYLFILRERDTASRGEAERRRERESQAGSAPAAQSLMWGWNSRNCEIMT